MNNVLKEAFSKLEHKLDYGDETELTDLEIAYLLDYIGNLESNAKNLQQRIDKAIEYIKENACFDGKQCKCSFSNLALDELLNILGSDSND